MSYLNDNNLLYFFDTLNGNKELYSSIDKSVAYVSDSLNISKITILLDIDEQFKKMHNTGFEKVIFSSNTDIEDKNFLSFKNIIPSVGELFFSIYKKDINYDYNDEQKKYLNMVINAITNLVSESKTKECINSLLTTDLITGVLTPAAFYEYLAVRIATNKIAGSTVVFLNIKNMKGINSRYSQPVGNAIMAQYAQKLRGNCATTETICRLGGDNFVLLINSDRTDKWKHILSSVTVSAIPQGENMPVECNVECVAGFAPVDATNKNTQDSIILPANISYRYAKNVKKVDFLDFSPEIASDLAHQQLVMSEFKKALKTKDLKVFYQPKVDIKTFKLCGAEALSRWNYNGEIKTPWWYIDILEETNLICALDLYNLEVICSDLKKWIDAGIEPVKISTNFSKRHLANENLADNIYGIITKYNIPTELIEIEITETTDVKEYSSLINLVNELHKHNIAVAIDDFGTGFSSVNILKDVPIDIIKFDKTLIDKTEFADKLRIVYSNLINMAKGLNITTVAEGVEDKEQTEFLKNIGCDIIQGYYFDKPIDHEEFTERLNNKQYVKD